MALETKATVSPATLSIVQHLLENQVQALYDDPYGVCEDDRQINLYHAQLKIACQELGVNWDETLRRDTTEGERRRMWTILKAPQSIWTE